MFMYIYTAKHTFKTAQEVMMKIVAEKAKYLANTEFKNQMKKNPGLLMELFST